MADAKFELRREDTGMPCECGGYMDRVKVTEAEDSEFGCGNSVGCCSRAFVCRVCGKRVATSAPAPEMK